MVSLDVTHDIFCHYSKCKERKYFRGYVKKYQNYFESDCKMEGGYFHVNKLPKVEHH